MRLWRISNYADLSGQGGINAAARWHNKGIPVVYLTETPALAMLEILVHLEVDEEDFPDSYQLLEIDYKEKDVPIEELSETDLPDNWRENESYTRFCGDQWLISSSSVLLRVPSAILPSSYNFLFNPRHEKASLLSITTVSKHLFDRRLIVK